ncbi:hypothetical protein [Sphingomonas sanxanigenens]|uniref:Uncharacterized protein n=1 Tax=Sphingomonas sanxanigenens DSM 19645 = NX02 TaxID=1123269 RepID=W0AIB8_9SPHN|nr:hypothetical protein [Sphingomonas sanxanigenens]AHE56013.1 hypothetical protein NX02_21915 [Sphingomonas sanxanigenens DSM 19645 = NX02]
MSQIKVNPADAMRGLTLTTKLTGMKRLAVRIWIGTRILMLAAMVFGCRVEVDIVDRRDT